MNAEIIPFNPDTNERAEDEPALIVDVEGFEGPLDLLLTLAREQKVDLAKISILALANQYLAFIEAGGYREPSLWLSEGWEWRRSNALEMPMYWSRHDGQWQEFTLAGAEPLSYTQEFLLNVTARKRFIQAPGRGTNRTSTGKCDASK